MKIKIIIVLVVLFMFMSGCLSTGRRENIQNTPYKINKSFDEVLDVSKKPFVYNNVITTSLVFNPVEISDGETIAFLPEQRVEEKKSGKVYTYAILLMFVGNSPVEIKEGESLFVYLNAEPENPIVLTSKKGSWGNRNAQYFGYGVSVVKELATYSMSKEQLLQITNALNVIVAVNGTVRTVTGAFIPKNFELLKQFEAEFID